MPPQSQRRRRPANGNGDDDNGHGEGISRRRQSRRDHHSEPSDDDDQDEDEDVDMDEADTTRAGGTEEQQLVAKLVRYALACEYARIPIKRDGIRDKGNISIKISIGLPT